MALPPFDQQIQDKADAFRGQMKSSGGIEAEIQNRSNKAMGFNINRDLIELLALQKLKSEKDQAAKEMQMAMEQNPQTIAEQRASEVTEQIKGEIQGELDKVSQVGKTLRLKDQQQKQRLQQAAAGTGYGLPAAAQRRPVNPANSQMMAGIGGVQQKRPMQGPVRGRGIATQPAPNMAFGAASGGIVSFQNTGSVKGNYRQISPASLAKLGYTQSAWSKLSDEEQQAAVEQYRTVGGRPPPVLALPKIDDPTGNLLPDNFVSNTMLSRNRIPPDPALSILPGDIADVPGAPDVSGAPDEALPIDTTPPETRPIVGAAKVDTTEIPGVEIVAPEKPWESPLGRTIQAGQETAGGYAADQMSRDADREGREAAAWADIQTNKTGIADAYSQQQKDLEKLYGTQAGARKKNQFWDLLAHAGGQGALSDIGRAAYGMRQASYGRGEQQLKGIQALEQSGLEQGRLAGEAAITARGKQVEITEQARAAGAESARALLEQQGDQLTEQAKQVLTANIANLGERAAHRREMVSVLTTNASNEVKAQAHNLNGYLTLEGHRIKKQVAEIAAGAEDRRTLLGALEIVQNHVATIKATIPEEFAKSLNTDPVYTTLMQESVHKPDDVELRKELKLYEANTRYVFTRMINDAVAEMEELQKDLYRMSTDAWAGVGGPNLTVTPIK